MEGAFAIRPDGGERMMDTLACAACGRSIAEAFVWKGNGERYYCNDFCAEAEEAESPALVPSMSEDAAATLPMKAVSYQRPTDCRQARNNRTITPPGARNP
jgi:hypothetical protein